MEAGRKLAAPIQRYNDPRLYGKTFVEPFYRSYQLAKSVTYPFHPACDRITECATRALKFRSAAFTLAATAVPALVGRIIQIIHYHSIPKKIRLNPTPVKIDNLQLPHLMPCPHPPLKFTMAQVVEMYSLF